MLTRSQCLHWLTTQQANLDVGASYPPQFLQDDVIHRRRVRLNDRARLRILDNGWEQR